MRCTTVKVGGFAHLMYVILHNGRVVREWQMAGVQGGTQRVGCQEAMPGSGMNRLLWQRSPPNNLDPLLDSGRSGQGRSVGWCRILLVPHATPVETID